MTTDDDLERRIQDYLEPGPVELADHVLWSARAQLKTTRRRRAGLAWLTPWRDHPMNQSTRLLLMAGGALALVVAIGAGILGAGGNRGVGQNPSAVPVSPSTRPAPSTQASTPASTPLSSAFPIPVYPAQSATPLASTARISTALTSCSNS